MFRSMRAARPVGFNYNGYNASADYRNQVAKSNPREWALAYAGAVVALKRHKESAYYRLIGVSLVLDWALNGRYIKVMPIDPNTGEGNGYSRWVHSVDYYRFSDSIEVYKCERKLAEMQAEVERVKREAESVAAAKLQTLSQNTVTRALVHAYSNDYCHETAVALISAGHKMPDVDLSFEVTVPVSIHLRGNDSYYPLRELFGITSGEVDGAKGLSIGNRSEVQDAIREYLMSGEVSLYSAQIEHTDTSVDWKAPILRTVETRDAMREVSTYGM